MTVLRYTRGDELEPVAITWYEPDGTLYDFSSGWTFRARIGTGAGFLVEKTSGFTGAATAPNLSINFITGELDGVGPGTYHLDVQATLTATVQTITRTWIFQVLSGVGTDTLPQNPTSLGVLGDLTVGGDITLGGDLIGFPELAAGDPTEVDLDTVSGVTTLTLLDTIQRLVYGMPTGQYFYSNYGLSAAQSMFQDTLTYMPVALRAGTVDRIGVDVAAAVAGQTWRLGIYADNGGLPGALIAEATSGVDTYPIDGSGTGMKTAAISAVLPKNGRYWVACVQQGGQTATIQAGPASNAGALPLPLGTTPQGGTTNFLSRTQTGQSGALPSSAAVGGTPSGQRFRVHLRYA